MQIWQFTTVFKMFTTQIKAMSLKKGKLYRKIKTGEQ